VRITRGAWSRRLHGARANDADNADADDTDIFSSFTRTRLHVRALADKPVADFSGRTGIRLCDRSCRLRVDRHERIELDQRDSRR
jgi:hypothetical protein